MPVFKVYSRESQNMVSKHKWSLITGKICMESTIVVIEQEGLLTQVFFPTGFTKYLFYRQSTQYHCLGLLQRSNFKWPIVESYKIFWYWTAYQLLEPTNSESEWKASLLNPMHDDECELPDKNETNKNHCANILF